MIGRICLPFHGHQSAVPREREALSLPLADLILWTLSPMNPLKVMDAKLDHTFLYVIGHKANDYLKHSYCKQLCSSVIR